MSPIKGLTDRGLSFPEIGQLRKGSAKPNDKQPGKDLDHFRVTFDEQEAAAAAKFRAVYGDQPKEINIILPFNELERMWDAFLEAYTAGRLVARSDGERYIYRVDVKTGEVVVKNGQPYTPYQEGQPVDFYQAQSGRKEPIMCKPTGRLKVIIPELARAAYITVLTTSIHDIANISAQLEAFKALNGGQIAGIPLVLRRRPKKISTPAADGKRARRVKWLLSIEADPEWVERRLMETKRLALPGNGLALLSDGGATTHDEPEEVIESTATWEDVDDAEDETGDIPLGADALEYETVAAVAQPVVDPTSTYADLVAESVKDPATAFWKLANRLHFDKQDAAAIVKETGQDMGKAFAALLKQAPPALM